MSNYEKPYTIELNGVCCKSGYRYLVKDIDRNIKQGEHWLVFGMNGCGKTTLLSIIAGFKHYTAGEIKIFGQKFSNETILPIREKIGFVSASFFDRFYTKESALNIVLSGKHGTLGLYDDITLDDVILAKQLLKELKLGDKINNAFDMFSKGERQNVLIARALFSNPDILILDEPCTGLDVYNRNYLFSTIEHLSKKFLTIIYVTHYVEEVIPLFEHTLLMKNGHVFAKGITEDMLTSEKLEKLIDYPVNVYRDNNGMYKLHIRTDSQLDKLLT